MPRSLQAAAWIATLAVLSVAAPAVSAQPVPGEWVAPAAPGPSLRVVASDASSVTVELMATWATPLADALAGSDGDPLRLLALATGGQAELSHELVLSARVPPAVAVLSADFDDVPLSAASAEAFQTFARPAAEVVSVGERRRQTVGSLALRLLHVDGDRLVRYRRLVVRVPKPLYAAVLAGRGGGNPHVAVTRSRLAEGRWFRIAVPRQGVFRLTAAYLRDSLGVTAPDLGRVGVYGNGARILPALNGAARPADLTPVPSTVSGDALLFYAEGPTWWDWVPEVRGSTGTVVTEGYWSHALHPFSKTISYFLRVDDPAPARLGTASFPSWPDAERLSRIDDRLVHERDLLNWERDGSGSGLEWVGESIPRNSSSLARLDTFPPGADAQSVIRYRTRVAARANPRVTISVSASSVSLATLSPFAVDLDGRNDGNLLNDARASFERTGAASLRLDYRSTGGNAEAGVWLDWLEAVLDRVPTAGARGVLRFATPGGRAGRFEVALQGFGSAPEVWDVTEPGRIARLGVQASGGQYVVAVEATDPNRPREIVAFTSGASAIGSLRKGVEVPNQNLHSEAGSPDYVIVTHKDFLAQAQRLADRRRQRDGLKPVIVTMEQVYNEFSSGTVDMRAARDYMKFLYDKAPDAARLPRYLLLLGDGHFDFRRISTTVPNLVPAYETVEMFSRSLSYTSDDYFGLLGDDEGVWNWYDESERIDVGVGRIPARTVQDAAALIDKIVEYEDPATRGSWRGQFTFVADDQFPNAWDTDLHVLNADGTAERAKDTDPAVTLRKIYSPSYPRIVTAEGSRRPQVNEAIVRAINEGTLIWNYSGHGGPDALGDEKYFTTTTLDRFQNGGRYPVFVTATCSFGKFDIADKQSLAEETLFLERSGGVAMLTTVRIVYTGSNPNAGTNFGLNVVLTEQMLLRDAEGRPRRLGDALYQTKNTSIGASFNNRKFNLLGDPAMRLGLPERRVSVTQAPLLVAFQEATIEGQVLALNGQPDATFSGEVDLTVFDAARTVRLPSEIILNLPGGRYTDRTARIYNGRATVQGGRFSSTFLVPQDVSYSGLPARISAYVLGSGTSDGFGQSTGSLVSAQAGARPDDRQGPDVRLFIDDTTFVSGGTARQGATLLARLSDPNGVNAAGAGVGHELLLTIDDDPSTAVDLGRYYTGDLDTYRSGRVRYPLPTLAPGPHTVTLTAWDGVNNSTTVELAFVVSEATGLTLRNVYPYPNPTTGPTRFTFEHNQPPGTPARVQLRIYTISGRPIRTIDGDEALPGGVLAGPLVQIPWDGRDDDLDRLATGVYLYRLRIETDGSDGGRQVTERVERLAIIR